MVELVLEVRRIVMGLGRTVLFWGDLRGYILIRRGNVPRIGLVALSVHLNAELACG